jgi:hypothetical protein
MKSHEILSDALGVQHAPEPEIMLPAKLQQSEQKTDETVETNPDQQEDYNLARKTFRDLIKQGNSAIEGITDLAKQSESPRAYEVLATLMKTVADTTKDLYDLQKKTKDLSKEDKNTRPQDEQRINVEKAVFVGSTAELLKQIKNKDA